MDRTNKHMPRTLIAVAAPLLPLTLLVAGCSGSSSGGSGSPSDSSQGSLAQRLTQAGIDCGDQKLEGHVSCTFQGQTVTVTPGAWSAYAAERRKVCAAGFI